MGVAQIVEAETKVTFFATGGFSSTQMYPSANGLGTHNEDENAKASLEDPIDLPVTLDSSEQFLREKVGVLLNVF